MKLVRINLLPTNLPPEQFDNVLIVMPFAPVVGEKIHLQGKLYKVKSREWDADSATLHCKVTVTLTN